MGLCQHAHTHVQVSLHCLLHAGVLLYVGDLQSNAEFPETQAGEFDMTVRND